MRSQLKVRLVDFCSCSLAETDNLSGLTKGPCEEKEQLVSLVCKKKTVTTTSLWPSPVHLCQTLREDSVTGQTFNGEQRNWKTKSCVWRCTEYISVTIPAALLMERHVKYSKVMKKSAWTCLTITLKLFKTFRLYITQLAFTYLPQRKLPGWFECLNRLWLVMTCIQLSSVVK